MENLINTKIRILSADHSRAFQEHVFSRGGNWECGKSKPMYLTAPILYISDEGCISFGEHEGFFVDHPHREITFDFPEVWDGMGLPPVGTECEYRLNDGTWYTCKIIYVLSGSDDSFVAWCDHLGIDQFLTFTSDRYKLQMRKIKTPEQIAREERLHAIDEMVGFVGRYSTFKDVMGVLYDAGYRKTEVKK